MLKRIEPQRTPGTKLAAATTVVFALIIAVLLLMPSPPGASLFSDKVAHLLAFAALALPLSLVRARFAAFTFIGLCAYGAGIELLQPFTGRAAELADFGMDVAGALIGAVTGAGVGCAWRSSGRGVQ